jgi:hypothetical protein
MNNLAVYTSVTPLRLPRGEFAHFVEAKKEVLNEIKLNKNV